MRLPLQDLNGPQRRDAENIIVMALAMDDDQARELEGAWDHPGEDYESYLLNCKNVWNALEESGRFLPLGWFEAIFADVKWAQTTRALHAIADAVCATLVRDLIDKEVYDSLVTPWRSTVFAVK